MATKKPKSPSLRKKVNINPPKGSSMEKFHRAMEKIVSAPKKDLKDK